MASASIDPGYEVVQSLRSFSGLPQVAIILSETKNDDELHNYLFAEGNNRVRLLKILLTQFDQQLESYFNATKEPELFDVLQRMCVTLWFSSIKNSRPFVIGKMPVEKQCLIWKRILSSLKDSMGFQNDEEEIENNVELLDRFITNPFLKDFLSPTKSLVSKSSLDFDCDINLLDCDLQKAKLKLEEYKKIELQSPEKREELSNSVLSPTVTQEKLGDTIKKWEMEFENHLEPNLRNIKPDEELKDYCGDKLSENIKALLDCCLEIQKENKSQNFFMELTDRIMEYDRTNKNRNDQ